MLPDWVKELARRVLVESISYPTFLGESYGEIVNYYASVLKEFGVHVTIHKVPQEYVLNNVPSIAQPSKPRYILLARVGSGERVLQFNGHYDVVPPGGGWSTTKPFNPREVDGRIYGRGATDMKGGIASFTAAIAYLASVGELKDLVVEGAYVPDEEVGGLTGTGYLMKELGSRPDLAIIAEPSGLGKVWIGHRGNVWLEVVVKGRQTHGSTPWLGINAFEKMIYLAVEFIEKYKPFLEGRKSIYEYDFPEAGRPTINIGGRTSSANAINIVPGEASFSIDRRLVIEEDPEQVVEELKEFLSKAAEATGAEIDVKLVGKSAPALTNPNTTLVKELVKAVSKVTGIAPKLIVCSGGLDLRYYRDFKVDAVAYGPGAPSVAHVADEYIELSDVYKAVEIYLEFIRVLQ
ncbi:MAG: M20 family metallopeptidase [Desulfurococcaceae archaeon]